MRRNHARRLIGAFLLGGALLGCGDDQEEVEPADPNGAPDAIEGLSREEIREKAEAMSPEEAEALGIVDTTIRVENPPEAGPPSPIGPPLPKGPEREEP